MHASGNFSENDARSPSVLYCSHTKTSTLLLDYERHSGNHFSVSYRSLLLPLRWRSCRARPSPSVIVDLVCLVGAGHPRCSRRARSRRARLVPSDAAGGGARPGCSIEVPGGWGAALHVRRAPDTPTTACTPRWIACADKAHKVDDDGGARACSRTPHAADTSTLVALRPPTGV